jgi:Spy/CpxP family protein refolding chaperone
MMMNLKKIFFLTFLIASIGIQAQVKIKKHSREKIHALKIAYLTDKLDLTEKEAQKFWPIYNKYDKIFMKLRIEERYKLKKSIKDAGGLEALSENDAKNIIDRMVAIEKKMYDTKKSFFESLKNVISSKKIITLQMAERDFNRNMLRKLRKPRKSKK